MRFLIPLLLAPTFAAADPCDISATAISGWNDSLTETKKHAEAIAMILAILKTTDPEAYEAASGLHKQPQWMAEGARESADRLLEQAKKFNAECN